MPPPVVELSGLSKDYGGGVGLHALDLELQAGEVLGFLGPNGAGKTTTIRLALDLIRPTRGTARLFGRPAGEPGLRRRVGYLPGELTLDERLTAEQMLRFLDALRPAGTPPADPRRRAELCERLRLPPSDLSRVLRDDSRGTRQKVGLVAAFQHDPDLLVLDEPTAGLDPLAREAVLELMREAGAAGRTVFHSSHVISEVDRTASRVAIVRAGRLVRLESIEVLRSSLERRMLVRFAGPVPVDELALPGVRLLEVDTAGRAQAASAASAASAGSAGSAGAAGAAGASAGRVLLAVSGELAPLLAVLARHPVRHLAFPEPDLEEAFRQHYSGDAP